MTGVPQPAPPGGTATATADGLLDTGAGTTDGSDVPGAGSASATVTPGEAWRKARGPAVVALVLLGVLLFAAMRNAGIRSGYLDPDAARPAGSRALARVTEEYGVPVERVIRPRGGAGTTTVVTNAELVDIGALRSILFAGGTDVVLVEADGALARALGLDVRTAGRLDEAEREPRCDLPEAVAAGSARTGGFRYRDAGCYGGTLAVLDRGDARVVLVGTGEFMTNERLDEDGNAALALGLLTRRDRVDWVHPRPDDYAEGQSPVGALVDVLPGRLTWGVLQLGVAAVLLALWRARRLGPVVAEPLPVAVRAAEAVEGRARLYEAGRARARAADALRIATRDRIAGALGLSRDADRTTVLDTVTARLRRPAGEVEALLYGPPPADDASLVRLANDLDTLDREVRST